MKKPERKGTKRFWVVAFVLALTMVFSGIIQVDVYATDYKAAILSGNSVVSTWETLDEALLNVTDGQTIRLLGSIEVTSTGESGIVNNGKTFTLDLGGQTITGDQAGALIQVNSGKVTIFNGEIINAPKTDIEPLVENRLAVAIGDSSVASVSFPVGYQPPSPMTASLVIPTAYSLNITGSTNGTIRYGDKDTGTLTTQMVGALYATDMSHNFYFQPDVGYKVGTLKVDGASQAVADYYTVSNLTEDATIDVGFDKITFAIAPIAYANNSSSKRGLIVAPSPSTVEYGDKATFNFSVRNGFKLVDVLVNDVSINNVTTIGDVSTVGDVTTLTLKNVTSAQDVKIVLQKTALFIMLDAGHFENYNHSPVLSSYYEGNTMWIYHQYLEQALEQYKNIIVDTTRINNSRLIGEALAPSQRGAMGEGYDLLLSVHSNACSSSGPDHPVAIFTLNSNYTKISHDLGLALANKVAAVMNTYEPAEGYGQLQSDGQDWYGINRGAASVGVPSIILEHSFHTNYRATVWLSSDANLRTLALAEAKVIADFYGVSSEMVIAPTTAVPMVALAAPIVAAPPAPSGPALSVVPGVKKATVSWAYVPGATGYQIYRAYGTSGKYYKVKTITRGGTLKWTNYGRAKGKIYTYKVRSYRTVKRVTTYGIFSIPKSVRI